MPVRLRGCVRRAAGIRFAGKRGGGARRGKGFLKEGLSPSLQGLDLREKIEKPFILPPDVHIFVAPVRNDIMPRFPLHPVPLAEKPMFAPDIDMPVVPSAFGAVAEMIDDLESENRGHRATCLMTVCTGTKNAAIMPQ